MAGLLTEATYLELEKEKVEERQLVSQVKSILVHETHMQDEMIKLQNELKILYYDDFKRIRQLEFHMLHNARYQSRKNMRMELLKEYMGKIRIAIDLAYGGEIGMSDSADIMSSIGIKGSSPVKFHSIEHDNDSFHVTMFYDTGSYTTVDRTITNDTTLVQTKTRLYLVSSHMLQGAPLSISEVRVVKGLKQDCLTMIHVTLNSYRIITAGNISCFRYGQGRVTYSLDTGSMLHLDGRDYCNNDCIEVGYRGFNNKHKNLPSLPSVQPAVLHHYFQEVDAENMPAPLKALEKSHQVAHDTISLDIRENEDMILKLHEIQAQDNTFVQYSSYSGYAAACISLVLIFVFICMCFKCKRNRPNVNNVEMKTFSELMTSEDPPERSVN